MASSASSLNWDPPDGGGGVNPALVAARAGLSRGWIEFKQTLTTPGDLIAFLITTGASLFTGASCSPAWRSAVLNRLNFPTSTCGPAQPADLRVYPPDQTAAVVLPDSSEAAPSRSRSCSSAPCSPADPGGIT